jgi:hypothetical protein
MDERSILMAQIEMLQDNLRRAGRALNRPRIDQKLSDRVRPPLSIELQEKEADLKQLLQEVADSQPLDFCWDSFRTVRQGCETIFRECLDFAQGALARDAGLDDGLCRVADALLTYLGRLANITWNRFTMLAEGEFFADLAQVIRLRFPDLSVWTLPIAAHEFGHFVGPEMREKGPGGRFRHPFEDMLETERMNSEKRWSYLHERFADVFAAYALGPAFACASILLRFDPRTAHLEKERHPGDAERVYLILKTLEKLGEDEGGLIPTPYHSIAGKLRQLWRSSLIAAKREPDLAEAATIPLDVLLESLYALLKRRMPDARYRSLLQAQMLASQLKPDRDTAPKAGKDVTLTDALNAAWYCRLQHWGENIYITRKIEERATALCIELAKFDDQLGPGF